MNNSKHIVSEDENAAYGFAFSFSVVFRKSWSSNLDNLWDRRQAVVQLPFVLGVAFRIVKTACNFVV